MASASDKYYEVEDMNFNRHKFYFFTALLSVAVLGIYLRVQNFSRGLEYDEIWTWFKYTTQDISFILSDLSSTNNHTLHSLATKLSTGLFGWTFIALRIPALIAGLCIPPLAGFLAWRLFRDKIASFLVFSICTFNVSLIYYSKTARGHTMEVLFVLLTGFSLFAMGNSKTERRAAPFVFLFSAVSAVLTMPSGIIFITPLCLLWFLNNVKWSSLRKWISGEWPLILSFCIVAVICLVWYGLNYNYLKAVQARHGENLSSPLMFLTFAWRMPWAISGFMWILMLVPLFSKEGRRTTGFCVLFLILVMPSVLVTKCGYEFINRVYLPLLPFIALGAANGFTILINCLPQMHRKIRYALCGAFISLLAAKAVLAKPPIDFSIITPEIVKSFPKDVFINYLPTDTYPILFNCRHFILSDNFERISKFSGLFAQVGSPGTIAGQESVYDGNAWLSVDSATRRGKIAVANTDIEIFNFRPIAQNDLLKGKIILAFIGPTKDMEMYDRLICSFFKPYRWLLLNSYLRETRRRYKDGLPVAEALATNSCDMPASGLLELQELSKGTVRFFILDDEK